MSTYLAFIDESGSYKKYRSDSFNKRYPYYVKSCFLIKDTKWKELSCFKKYLCEKYNIGLLDELKWCHLWMLNRRDKRGRKMSYSRNEEFLKKITFGTAENFVKEFIAELPSFEPIIIFTITPNCVFFDRVDEMALEKMHFQDITQRIQMEMDSKEGDNLAIIFADQLSKEIENEVKDRYHTFYQFGDFIKEYNNVMDSINFQYSHHCCGIQMADFLAGILVGFLREYTFSTDIFAQDILAKIRTGVNNKYIGYGVIDVPKRDISKEHLKEKLESIIPI